MNVIVRKPGGDRTQPDALRASLFVETGIAGVYGRTYLFERIVDALQSLISSLRDPAAEIFRFPPVMSRRDIQSAGYLKSFPHFLGCVCCLTGSEIEIRTVAETAGPNDRFGAALSETDLVLTPAACYPIYPIAAARGPVADNGLLFDVSSDCFRREPSTDIDRLQSFRMREFVRIARPEQIVAFRDEWMDRARHLAEQLCLRAVVEQASDPFFGRGGQLTAIAQLQQSLKFELLIPVRPGNDATACMSFNYHRDHFGETWGIRDFSGDAMHTGCVAFGIDRLALALFASHGLDLDKWPTGPREALRL